MIQDRQPDGFDYESAWKKLELQIEQGLPKSARAIAEEIYSAAKMENNSPQKIKALIYICRIQMNYEEEESSDVYQKLLKEIAVVKEPEKSLIKSITAHFLQQYYSFNSWKISSQTNVDEASIDWNENRLDNWSALQFDKTIKRLYEESLSHPLLRKISSAEYSILLEDPTIEKLEYSQNMYRVLLWRYINYLQNPITIKTLNPESFRPTQAALIAPRPEFVSGNFDAPNDIEGTRLVKRLQDLLREEAKENHSLFLGKIDLYRLRYFYQNSSIAKKEDIYLHTLEWMAEAYHNTPVYAEIAFYIANHWHYTRKDEIRNHKALQWIENAVQKYPTSFGTGQCLSLKQQITNPILFLKNEGIVTEKEDIIIQAESKNNKWVNIKLVAAPSETEGNFRTLNNDSLKISWLAKQNVVKTWKLALIDNGNFTNAEQEFNLGKLPLGSYLIFYSPNSDFSSDIQYNQLTISNMAAAQLQGVDNMQLLVVDRISGKPLQGVSAEFYQQEYDRNSRKSTWNKVGTAITNKDGICQYPAENRSLRVEISKGKDKQNLGHLYQSNYRDNPQNYQSTLLFTDRSIYRPGQTIYFKAIQLEYDKKSMPKIVQGGKRTISFYDANRQLIEELTLEFNEFGSASGSFSIPVGRLSGAYSISSTNGYHSISVEEYKRPTFEIVIEKPTGTYKLGDNILIKGSATGLAGNAVSNAAFTYTIKRTVSRWRPVYNRMWIPPGWAGPAEIISYDRGETDEVGNFQIAFNATAPDISGANYKNSLYHFEIEISVTDRSGETREKKESISISNMPYFLSIQSVEQADIAELNNWKIHASNAGATAIEKTGKYSIIKLKEPSKLEKSKYWTANNINNPYSEESSPYAKWPNEKIISTGSFTTGNELSFPKLTAGVYKIHAVSIDGIEASQYLILTDIKKKKFPMTAPVLARINNLNFKPGEVLNLSIGTPVKETWVYLRLMRAADIIDSSWIKTGKLANYKYTIKEEDKGGLQLSLNYVFENRVYDQSFNLDVAHYDKNLEIEFDSFRDKLLPGEEEEYKITIKNHEGKGVLSELLASMYDASLDQLKGHQWPRPSFRTHFSYSRVNFLFFGANTGLRFIMPNSNIEKNIFDNEPMIPELISIIQNYNYYGTRAYSRNREVLSGAPRIESMDMQAPGMKEKSTSGPPADMVLSEVAESVEDIIDNTDPTDNGNQSEGHISLRENLNETVFFYPHLSTDQKGNLSFSFKMNEALTRWKLMLFAHNLEASFGYKEMSVITSKNVMVIPNKPRTLRMGDTIHISTRVANLSGQNITADVSLSLNDIVNNSAYQHWITDTVKKAVIIPAGQTEVVSWVVAIPEGNINMVNYVIAASANNHTDGESNAIPVVSNRILVTESLPMFIPGGAERSYKIEALRDLNTGSKIPVSYTLEATANPVWYAIQALPYLKSETSNSTDDLLHLIVANIISKSIVEANPMIQSVIKSWSEIGSDQLMSNLEKNTELKTALLEETPWVLDAIRERNQKHSITALFNSNNINAQLTDAIKNIQARQMSNGGFIWYPGSKESEHITMKVMEGIDYIFRYKTLEFDKENEVLSMFENAEKYLDEKFLERFLRWKEINKNSTKIMEEYRLSTFELRYMQLKTSSLSVDSDDSQVKEMTAYYLRQIKKFHITNHLYDQLLIGFVLKANKLEKEANAVLKSLKEKSGSRQDYGMYWKMDSGISWTESSIDIHAKAIHFFILMGEKDDIINQLRVWLLRNKKLNNWGNNSSTAMAVHGLLMQQDGKIDAAKMLATKPLSLRFSGNEYDYNPDDHATGYFKKRWHPSEINEQMSNIEISNPNINMAFASAYWQFLEDGDKIQSYKATPLKIERVLYVEVNTLSGKKLEILKDNASVKPGSMIVSRINIYAEQDMSFLHLKVMRAAGCETSDVLSGYRWSSGFGYYHSIRDLADHYYIDYLPKGSHVFESRMIATHKGSFSLGPVNIQSMYSPDYGSISAGGRLRIN